MNLPGSDWVAATCNIQLPRLNVSLNFFFLNCEIWAKSLYALHEGARNTGWNEGLRAIALATERNFMIELRWQSPVCSSARASNFHKVTACWVDHGLYQIAFIGRAGHSHLGVGDIEFYLNTMIAVDNRLVEFDTEFILKLGIFRTSFVEICVDLPWSLPYDLVSFHLLMCLLRSCRLLSWL